MIDIPDQLEYLFTTSIEQHGDSYRIELPRSELEQGTITAGETYQVAIVSGTPRSDDAETRQQPDGASSSPESDSDNPTQQSPPVEPGDVREVTIESLGDQGDGIAKIDRGYVVIVPGTRPDDEVTVEIENARENVAFARVRDDNHESASSSEFGDGFANETFNDDE
jgi:predicted RNA-binding protein with TRAM domain